MRLDGEWFNELGSKMVLRVDGPSISGTYHTAVGNASGEYALVGRADTPRETSQSVGFVVSWQNEYQSADSLTAWSGQLQVIDGEEMIVTTWLLTIETAPGEDWKSTMVGRDVFKRNPTPAAKIEKNTRMRAPSHPLAAVPKAKT